MNLKSPVRFVIIPATSANHGPGFDCMNLSLDLWNEVSIEPGGESIKINDSGEGAHSILRDSRIPQWIGIFTRVRPMLYL
jgi:homoserine kinase